MPHNSAYITVYTASAGSGKTYTLAAEYIARLLASPTSQHRRVLAVTFTNKATAEMKERILQRLFDLSAGQAPDFRETLLTRTRYAERLDRLGEDELRRRAGQALQAILHDYDHFHVQTIDRFFQQLLANLARELGLSPNYRVDIDDQAAVDQAVDSLLRGLNRECLSSRQRKRQQRIVEWIREYIAYRVAEGKSWNLKNDLRKFAGKNVLSETFQTHKGRLMSMLEDDKAMATFRDRLFALKKEYENHGGKFQALQQQVTAISKDFYALDATCLQRKGQYFRGFIEKMTSNLEEILSEGKDPISPSVSGYMDDPCTLIKEACRDDFGLRDQVTSMMKKAVQLREDLQRARKILTSCALVAKSLNPLRLLGALSQEIDELNAEHNRLLLSQTKTLFSGLVKGADAPFVFEKAGLQFRHVMIDEFQDTARTQWNNLKKLILENAAAGDSCLLVGDVKQSIYRFNGGDWRILAHIEQEAGAPIDRQRLDDNFRSEWHVVRFNNGFFRAAAACVDEWWGSTDVSKIYETDSPGQNCRKSDQNGYVRVTVADGHDLLPLSEDAETADGNLYTQIDRLHAAGLPYGEMAILVRRKVEGRRIMEHFARFHPQVPFVSDEAFFYSNSPAVCLLIDAMRYLHSRVCRAREEAEGRSPLRHVDTVALVGLVKAYRWMVRDEKAPFSRLAEQPEAWLPEGFADNFAQLYDLPLYELCTYLCELFGLGAEQKNADVRGQQPYVLGFLDEVLAFLEDHPSDVGAFLNYWDERLSQKSIPTTETDGLRIVTIHKSKGLAYHTVLVPFCDWPVEKTKTGADNYLWSRAEDAPFTQFDVFPVTQTKAVANSTYHSDYESEMEHQRVEALNLAYVAFTRAQKNLLIWADAQSPRDVRSGTLGNVTRQALESLANGGESGDTLSVTSPAEGVTVYERGTPFVDEPCVPAPSGIAENANPFVYHQDPEPVSLNVSSRHVCFRQSSESLRFLRTEDDAAEADRTEYVRRGNLYHAALARVGTAADASAALADLRRQGLLSAAEEPEMRDFIEKRLRSRAVAAWFDGSWELRNETDIYYTDEAGIRRKARPDRVMLKDGAAVVVDYKFARPQPEHKAQVAEYVRLLSRMGYVPVSGFLWYVYDNQVIPVE